MSVELNEELRDIVNGALVAGNPMLLAVVTADGKPRLSFRGSVQTHGAGGLGFWARKAEGETMEGIRANADVALMYRDPGKRIILQFGGRARLAQGAERDAVYEAAPEPEQRADADRKGAGVVIDLERVEGIMGMGEDGKPRFVRLTD
jgi:hypothetical protein